MARPAKIALWSPGLARTFVKRRWRRVVAAVARYTEIEAVAVEYVRKTYQGEEPFKLIVAYAIRRRHERKKR